MKSFHGSETENPAPKSKSPNITFPKQLRKFTQNDKNAESPLTCTTVANTLYQLYLRYGEVLDDLNFNALTHLLGEWIRHSIITENEQEQLSIRIGALLQQPASSDIATLTQPDGLETKFEITLPKTLTLRNRSPLTALRCC